MTAGAVTLAWLVPFWPGAQELLIYDRAECLAGELWRLLTCHWVHVSWSHLTVDTLLLGLGGILLEVRRDRCLLPVIALSALGISMTVWWLKPEWNQYSGLSGIVMAVWSAISMDCLGSYRRERVIGLGLAAFLLAKIAMDVLTTTPLVATWTDDCVESATLAHAVGWLTGALIGSTNRLRCTPASTDRICRRADNLI